ncbi:MAG: hypothetical protein ACOC29_02750 [Candidatus Sumerlaeota bacterium]
MSSGRPLKPFDLSEIRTFSARERGGRFDPNRLARVPDVRKSLDEFFTTLPKSGKTGELHDLAEHIIVAGSNRKQIIFLIDEHTVEGGLAPLLIELMRRDLLTHIVMNSRCAVMDFETAFFGHLPETERQDLREGMRGMARETGEWMNTVINDGSRRGFGIVHSLGRGILDRRAAYDEYSILAHASALRVPVTVAVSVGADVIQQSAHTDGSWLGKAAYKDFQTLTGYITNLNQGGVVLDISRSSNLSEVFLNSLNMARNLGNEISNFVTARAGESATVPETQAPLAKAVWDGGRYFDFNLPLEFFMPLLYAATIRLLA